MGTRRRVFMCALLTFGDVEPAIHAYPPVHLLASLTSSPVPWLSEVFLTLTVQFQLGDLCWIFKWNSISMVTGITAFICFFLRNVQSQRRHSTIFFLVRFGWDSFFLFEREKRLNCIHSKVAAEIHVDCDYAPYKLSLSLLLLLRIVIIWRIGSSACHPRCIFFLIAEATAYTRIGAYGKYRRCISIKRKPDNSNNKTHGENATEEKKKCREINPWKSGRKWVQQQFPAGSHGVHTTQ